MAFVAHCTPVYAGPPELRITSPLVMHTGLLDAKFASSNARPKSHPANPAPRMLYDTALYGTYRLPLTSARGFVSGGQMRLARSGATSYVYRPTRCDAPVTNPSTAVMVTIMIISPSLRLMAVVPMHRALGMDTCMSIAYRVSHQLDEDTFRAWNPAVGEDCGGLYVNYYYCVLAPLDLAAIPPATTQYTFTSPSEAGLPTTTWNLREIAILRSTFSGAAAGYLVLAPASTSAGCADLQDVFSLAANDVEAWNTGVDCTATLSSGILYCVGDPTALPSPLPT
ncbi:hypothetical protein B0T26DRAFT_753622 [Lasiosphaeria miniovina]|uniref:LysM domain-containing protein n=1 Tax=Lasiosphaeria miniovina TaxID=1954250 RepID=A0AA40DUB5_9PEZI|nr:uncharacterized protein B0T26DRAFT_753622 [Lasiosphaeria miniovina]KAK0713526.1 hypothetical protein B0T26DRAFT_753622 [Lasiosphaeria miniovina]